MGRRGEREGRTEGGSEGDTVWWRNEVLTNGLKGMYGEVDGQVGQLPCGMERVIMHDGRGGGGKR